MFRCEVYTYANRRGISQLRTSSSNFVYLGYLRFPTATLYMICVRAMGFDHGGHDFLSANTYAGLRGGILIVIQIF